MFQGVSGGFRGFRGFGAPLKELSKVPKRGRKGDYRVWRFRVQAYIRLLKGFLKGLYEGSIGFRV